jgi:hypothetical protein
VICPDWQLTPSFKHATVSPCEGHLVTQTAFYIDPKVGKNPSKFNKKYIENLVVDSIAFVEHYIR